MKCWFNELKSKHWNNSTIDNTVLVTVTWSFLSSMAGPQVSQSSGYSRWKQWWRRSPNTCCSKRILLLLMWQAFFAFSPRLFPGRGAFSYTLGIVSSLFAPLIGWLADVKFGRYEMIKIGSLASFFGNTLYFIEHFVTLRHVMSSWLGILFSSAEFVLFALGLACYSVALLPFLTDQIIGASSDELSAVVHWYFWANNVGLWLNASVSYFSMLLDTTYFSFLLITSVPLAVIIISDCLCQQWLDRTHKVTNPIKLIIQVLNYTRKHSYPERRSAFTYIDEEQPTRIDYGKEKFGGPFTEEEVEDVKTVLRLLPLVMFLSATENILINVAFFEYDNTYYVYMWTVGWSKWLFPLLLIPLHQCFLRRYVFTCSIRMLKRIGIGLLLFAVGYLLFGATQIWAMILSHDVHRFLSCMAFNNWPHVSLYLKLGPCVVYGIGKTITGVLILEFIIAQSPDKMKGFVIGVMLGVYGLVDLACGAFYWISFTICRDITAVVVLLVLFVILMLLCKCYTLRERNREINIQAIVEEHYERYMERSQCQCVSA